MKDWRKETNLLRGVNDTRVVTKLQHTQNGSENGVDQETRQALRILKKKKKERRSNLIKTRSIGLVYENRRVTVASISCPRCNICNCDTLRREVWDVQQQYLHLPTWRVQRQSQSQLYLFKKSEFPASVLLLQLVHTIAQIVNVFLEVVHRFDLVPHRRHVALHVAHLPHQHHSPFKEKRTKCKFNLLNLLVLV